jgi:spermidine synthase
VSRVPPASLRLVGLQIALVSFTVLFQELLLIRWLGQQVRALAYFPNLILIASFLGLGIGALAGGRRWVRPLWGPGLLALVGTAVLLSRAVITQEFASEHLWLLYYDLPNTAPVLRGLRLPLLAVFVLTALSFVPLGGALAERLQVFREAGRTLAGYLWDIGGSALGAGAFVAVSFLGTRPPVWLAVLAACGLLVHWRQLRIVAGVGAAAAIVLSGLHDRADVYSPYYALTVDRNPDSPAVAVLANGSLHQYAMPVQRQSPSGSEFTRLAREGYHLPYRLLKAPPRRVLVVGAGTGNDVAVALDAGAERVDAVEIDPRILGLGVRLHPDRPYASPRVRRIVADARSYLQETGETYDLIVFGTLDSMTRLSALSTVRLDNFVYTVEAFAAARRRLSPGGGLVLYFMVGKPYLLDRLGGMVSETFDETPLAYVRHHNVFNTVLMAGPAFAHHDGERRQASARAVRAEADLRVELSRDDWPFFYLEHRGVSGFYLSLIGAIALLAVVALLAASPDFRASARRLRTVDVEMLLFGMAFLLLETRAVTALNLLWGATWLTNAVVLVSIFVVIFGGTLLAARARLSFGACVVGLLASLAVVYAFPLSAALGTGLGPTSLASLLAAGLPIFFASICFAQRFAARADAGAAFGWNLLGAVLGGLAEFSSMVIGLRHLVAVAAVLYLLAAWIALRRDARPPAPPLPSAT